MAPSTTTEALVADFRRLGVAPGDLVMVHASLRAIGPVPGGAAAVIEALEAAVGGAGTLLMVVGARDDWDWVNARPAHERPQLLARAPAFARDQTPADPEVGGLAEVFRTLPGTVVNDHPDGRFAARGRLAATLLDGLPWDDYYGPGSALARLVDAGGRILRLGASADTVTLLHLAEYLSSVPGKRRIERHHKIGRPDGTAEIRTVTCLDDADGIVDWSGGDYFALVLRSHLALGRARAGRVGGAGSELIEARDLLEHAVAWMNEHLRQGSSGPSTDDVRTAAPPH